MENHNDNSSTFTWAIVILLAVAGYFWYHSNDLNNQLNAYKEQNSEYETCVSDYKTHEEELTTAVTDAASYLEGGGQDNYRSAEDSLGINTDNVNCDISDIKDLMDTGSSSDSN